MSNETGQDKNAVKQIRDLLGARFGEIVTGLIGDSSVEKAFNGGSPPAEASAAVAEKAGVVSAETKTALLIAQAAERTLRAVAKIEFFSSQQEQIVADLKQQIEDKQYAYAQDFEAKARAEIDLKTPRTFLQRVFQSNAERYALTKDQRLEVERGQRNIEMDAHEARQTELGYVSPNSTTFKYVGSDGDADSLKSAQATMVAAQMYLNNEIESRLYKSYFPLDIGVGSVGTEFIDGLKQKALGDLKTASSILGQEGHGGAAARLNAVVASLDSPSLQKSAPGPDALVKKMYEREEWNVGYSNQQMNMWTMATFAHRTGFDAEHCEKLMKLINPSSGGLKEPAQTVKAENAPAFSQSRP